MPVICPTSQAKRSAANWHDGQITRGGAYPNTRVKNQDMRPSFSWADAVCFGSICCKSRLRPMDARQPFGCGQPALIRRPDSLYTTLTLREAQNLRRWRPRDQDCEPSRGARPERMHGDRAKPKSSFDGSGPASAENAGHPMTGARRAAPVSAGRRRPRFFRRSPSARRPRPRTPRHRQCPGAGRGGRAASGR